MEGQQQQNLEQNGVVNGGPDPTPEQLILDGLTLKRTQFEHFSRNLGDVSLDNLNLLNEKANLSFHYATTCFRQNEDFGKSL
uniref:Uncharacterized protein n=1 Tax=Meloidogyne javanica TaxID=6303 RepID=A0A915M5Q8_MELJA